MNFQQLFKKDSPGMALFMVLATIAVLSIVIAEFTYVSQLTQISIYGRMDQLKAHYTAKSAFKLSLLRLKMYQQLKDKLQNSPVANAVPQNLLNSIWSFPIQYPIPTDLPGLSLGQQTMLKKFQKTALLEGTFSAQIESESGKYNLNWIIPSLLPQIPQKTTPVTQATPTQPLSPEALQKSFFDILKNRWEKEGIADPDFNQFYSHFRVEDFFNQILNWTLPMDKTPQTLSPDRQQIDFKRAPFYAMTELHALNGINEELYDFWASGLTAIPTQGVNINSMNATTIQALFPQFTAEEIQDFLTYRDAPDDSHPFKDLNSFFDYLHNSVAAFQGENNSLEELKKNLKDRNIPLLLDETHFKITVQASMNQAHRTLEAWVAFKKPTTSPSTPLSPSGLTVYWMKLF